MKITNTDQIVNAILNPSASEETAVAGFRILHQNAAEFGGLSHIFGRSNELLGVVAQRDAQIAALKAKVEAAQHALKAAERSSKAFAAEQAAKKKREVEERMIDAVSAMIRGSTVITQPQPASPSRNQGARAKMAASSRARDRTRSLPRGADTDNMVLSLLTNELKCISTLFHQAQGLGFGGTENAIRFAALRLAQAGNAIEGQDYKDRVAYRRA